MSKLNIFTDGACSKNGKRGACAGIGVYFDSEQLDDISEPFKDRPTNQRAELFAIYRALEMIKDIEGDITIYSDSIYSINCLTKWIHSWKKNNFKTSKNKPVKNVDIIVKIDKLLENMKINFKHVRAHTNRHDYLSIGNDRADRLAREAII